MRIRFYPTGSTAEPSVQIDTWQREIRQEWNFGSRSVVVWIGERADWKAPKVCLHLTPEEAVAMARDLVAEARKMNRQQAREIERTARNIGKDAQKGTA